MAAALLALVAGCDDGTAAPVPAPSARLRFQPNHVSISTTAAGIRVPLAAIIMDAAGATLAAEWPTIDD